MSDSSSIRRRSVLKTIGISPLTLGVGNVSATVGRGSRRPSRLDNIVPAPVEVSGTGVGYAITEDTVVAYQNESAASVAEYVVDLLRPPTGYELPVVEGAPSGSGGRIALLLDGASDEVGDQGYHMQVNPSGVKIRANDPAGLFAGVQTLRQLLPPVVEADSEQSADWSVPGAQIRDYPRFWYRGAHLDVARHFFDVGTVKQYVDYLAQYKVNHLHLHLTDDQGWRIEIDSWPNLTDEGADSEVGGGPGGYYTKKEYTELVEYARDRFITVIPEIDMPGHTGAALESYADLNCDGEKRQEDTGTNVGDTSLCIDKEVTYEFIDDVIREISEITPGPYLHIGGDEAYSISDEEYNHFMRRAIDVVRKYGKHPLGWHQILGPDPAADVIPQFWSPSRDVPEVAEAAANGHEIIASPASHAYLDMKYNEDTELGLDWAGLTPVPDAYDWDPGNFIGGVEESAIMGPETALWSETITNLSDIEFMLFPRFTAVAELGWSPDEKTDDWSEFSERLGEHGPRWDVQGINYYEAPQIPWS